MRVPTPTRPLLAILTSAFLLTGCGTDIVGNWQSREKLSNGERNRLTFQEDGEGSAKVFAQLAAGEALTKVKYDTEWEIDGNGDFDVTATCTEGCNTALDFEMECTLGEGDLLDCVAKSPFTEYGYFEFEPMVE